jgi:hypothetical protein
MYSLFEKYEDMICEREGVLYVLRSRLCDSAYRVYLAPMGEKKRLRQAFETIFEDAKAYQAKVKFVTLTETYKNDLEELYPGRFSFEEKRDLAEYIYTTESMSTFLGGKLAKRRKEVHQFWRIYGDRASVAQITKADFPEILSFQKKWMQQNSESHDRQALEREERTIQKQLEHYDELRLSGVVMRIDDEVRGYGYGCRLGKEYYDALIEKGDRQIEHSYKVLRQESVKQCAMDCKYVNLEEDIGIIGLRNLKNAYQPAFLLLKFVAIEE